MLDFIVLQMSEGINREKGYSTNPAISLVPGAGEISHPERHSGRNPLR